MNKSVIIVPVFEDYERLQSLIDSLEASINIILIDNSKHTQALNLDRKNILQIETKANIGYGRACNIGIQKAKELGYKKAVICNQDVCFRKGAVVNLISELDKHPKSILVPLVYTYHNTLFEDYVIQSYGQEFEHDYVHKKVKDTYRLNNTGLCCFAINLSILDSVALFDPLYFMYWEDTDFINRCRIRNFPLLLITNAAIHHDAQELDRGNYRDKALFRTSKAIFNTRWNKQSIFYTSFSLKKGALKYILKMKLFEASRFIVGLLKIVISFFAIRNTDSETIQKRIDRYISIDSNL